MTMRRGSVSVIVELVEADSVCPVWIRRVCGGRRGLSKHGLGGEKRREKNPGAEAENGSQGTAGNAKTSRTLS